MQGNILVYLVMVMLIFGVLGVTMVSLFSTSISSSATDNDQRRALLLSESGMRYGMSELRNRGFLDNVIDPLNQTIFNLRPSGVFDLNILSYWFESASDQDIASGSGTITADIPKGEIPSEIWASAPANLFLVHCNYINLTSAQVEQNPLDSARALVSGFIIDPNNRTTLGITLSDDGTDGFVADRSTQLCFAVKPTADQLILPFTELRVDAAAKAIFPKADGVFEVNRRPFFYKRAIDRGSYVELTDITFASWDPWYSFPQEQVRQASDYIILSPRNYLVLSQGQSSDVTFGGDIAHSLSIPRGTAGGEPPDIGPDNLDYSEDTGDFQQVESNSDFVQLNVTDKSLTIGGGTASSVSQLGAVWFKDTRNIGGNRNYCSNGRCLFGLGIRAFFTLEIDDPNSSSDGVLFALINASGTGDRANDTISIGGDFEGSELLGYAGDSRLRPNPNPLNNDHYLDKSRPRGLQPPKFGLEFDTKVNLDEPPQFCLYDPVRNIYNLGQDTRNDPDPGSGRNTIQYIFWGDSRFENIICRGDSADSYNAPSYDDNRHELNPTYSDPKNYRDRMITSVSIDRLVSIEDGAERPTAEVPVELDSQNDWLKGITGKRQWAVRLEVIKEDPSNPDFVLRTWIRQCNGPDCDNILGGTFFSDTRINYPDDLRPPQLKQTITLSSEEAAAFRSFIFGFTSSTDRNESQPITIRNFQLSFRRPNDPKPGIINASQLP